MNTRTSTRASHPASERPASERTAGKRPTSKQLAGNPRTGNHRTSNHRASDQPNGKQREPRLRPGAWDRIRRLLPVASGARALALRRVAAVACVLFAGLLALHPATGRASSQTTALVAAHDLAPGHAITPADVVRRELPEELLPRGALRDPGAVRGRTLSSASRSGEVLTDARLAGQELTGGGDGRAAVPVRLADPAIAELLQPGQQVDIITTDPDTGPGSVLAERAPVISVRPAGKGREGGRLVVVRLPRQRASAVAAASLSRSVTVTLR